MHDYFLIALFVVIVLLAALVVWLWHSGSLAALGARLQALENDADMLWDRTFHPQSEPVSAKAPPVVESTSLAPSAVTPAIGGGQAGQTSTQVLI